MAVSRKPSFVHRAPSAHDAAVELHRHVSTELNHAHQFVLATQSIVRGASTVEERNTFREGVEGVTGFVEGAAAPFEKIRDAGDGSRALRAVPKYAALVQQRFFDIARLKADAHLARIAARSGSDAAAAAETFLRPMINHAETMYHADVGELQRYHTLASEYGDVSQGRIGKLALNAEAFLDRSSLGRKVLGGGRILANEHLGTFLSTVGVATAGWKAYDETPTSGVVGKVAHGAMVSALQWGSKELQVADPAITFGLHRTGMSDKEAEGYTVSKWFEGTANQFFYLGQAIYRHDSAPLSELHRQNMSGANGKVLQGYAMLGEQLAQSGVIDSAVATTSAVVDKVSNSVTKSLSWWDGLAHAH